MIGSSIRLFTALVLLANGTLAAGAGDRTVRIGFQKNGTLNLLKARGGLDAKLGALGISVTWAEFPGGPQLLEAMNAGAIDFGETGEAPPIFAQTAGPVMTYVASAPPAPLGEAILVPKNSPIEGVADLKGKRVALNKGSNVHYLLVRALEKAGLAYADVHTIFLPPADARAAFENGSVDAWAIWDPYYAAAQASTGARTLATGAGLVPNVEFYLAARSLAANDPKVVDVLIDAMDETDRWVEANIPEAAKTIGTAIHLPPALIETAMKRRRFGVTRVTDDVMAEQQKIADVFAGLGLLPRKISVADAMIRATH